MWKNRGVRSAVIAAVSTLLSACAANELGRNPPAVTPAGFTGHTIGRASSYRVLYRFGFHGVGVAHTPLAGLLNVGGLLYGTTAEADTRSRDGGTVYSITAAGHHKTLHYFFDPYHVRGPDGYGPMADLTEVNGTLYGTTNFGGGLAQGTVYSVTPTGTERILHSFGYLPDGAQPQAGLTELNGTLYGTTTLGGVAGSACVWPWNDGCGTIYSVTPSGAEHVLYRFSGGSDGEGPAAQLVAINGVLYGTTQYAGATAGPAGAGTVFAITPNGSLKVLHAFGSRRGDGWTPVTGLVAVNGTLYGTTKNGGQYGDGTVFSITTDGREKVLYSFRGDPDGWQPEAKLTYLNGMLYGTTRFGGGSEACGHLFGCGTVYGITTSGVETVLYGFTGGLDGALPLSTLAVRHGTLYGTTEQGGDGACKRRGCGTAFALTP
ncbi:MAG: hypothetical protein JO030_02595 [Candidatus Eremiobacteraeota bacterium]|nr:hypothetical protein [Candidatus Eremiobacteraeota bacterium]